MVELVGERGYEASGVAELCDLAGVSEGVLRERFPGGGEECLVAAYDMVVERGRLMILGRGSGWLEALAGVSRERRLQELAGVFAQVVVSHPDAARLALVEAVRAAPEAPAVRARVQRTRGVVERALAQSLRAGDGRVPARAVRAMVEDGARLVRRRLGEGRMEGLGEELAQVCVAAIERPPR